MDHYHWNRDFRLHYLQGEHLFTLVNIDTIHCIVFFLFDVEACSW